MSTPSTTVPPALSQAAAQATRSPAALLRSSLSGLLVAHGYLVGLMTGAVAAGADPAPIRSVVDRNDADLAVVVGQVYTPATGQQFGALWPRHVDLVLAYARAKRAGDTAGTAQARAGMNTFRSDLAVFFGPLSPSLTASTVTDLFSVPLSGLLSAADAQVTGGPQQFTSLRTAAASMPAVAELLTKAFVAHAPTRYSGNPNGAASTLLTLTQDLLVEHVFLLAVTTGAQAGGGDVKAASNTLDANSEALANVLVSAYGSPAGATFLSLWRAHIGFFVDYTRARLAGNQADAALARSRLDQFGQDLAGFLTGANPYLTRPQVAALLSANAAASEAMIDAQVAHSPQWSALALDAGQRIQPLGAVLAGALASQLPGLFTP